MVESAIVLGVASMVLTVVAIRLATYKPRRRRDTF
jgi:type II secretory pathway pseudopilin PulG